MKKTGYRMIVSSGFFSAEIVRRVWMDENGEYFVKFDGEFRNVTFAKNDFIED